MNLITSLKNAIRPSPKPYNHGLVGLFIDPPAPDRFAGRDCPTPFPAFFRALEKFNGAPLIAEEDKERIIALKERFDEREEFYTRHTDQLVINAAREKLLQLRTEDIHGDAERFDQEAALRRATVMRTAIRNEMAAIDAEAIIVVAPIAEKLRELTLRFQAESEETERAWAEDFGLDYTPSLRIVQLHRFAIALQAYADDTAKKVPLLGFVRSFCQLLKL